MASGLTCVPVRKRLVCETGSALKHVAERDLKNKMGAPWERQGTQDSEGAKLGMAGMVQ